MQVVTAEIDDNTRSALSTKSATSTPWQRALGTYLKYRTRKSYMDVTWLAPRIADKIIFTVLISTLYWGVGSDFSESNVNNVAAVLFSALPDHCHISQIIPSWNDW
jgi:hypothetical protein